MDKTHTYVEHALREKGQADTLVGRTLTVETAKHSGHTVTIERRDIEKPQAFWLRCECGEAFLCGSYWLERYLSGNGEYPLYGGV